MELFDNWFGLGGSAEAFGRYAHYLAGITWIGLLYFFNFIQGAAFGEMGDAARGEALRKITWRTLWWFRWAAALTWVSGLWILFAQDRLFDNMDYWKTASGMVLPSACSWVPPWQPMYGWSFGLRNRSLSVLRSASLKAAKPTQRHQQPANVQHGPAG